MCSPDVVETLGEHLGEEEGDEEQEREEQVDEEEDEEEEEASWGPRERLLALSGGLLGSY